MEFDRDAPELGPFRVLLKERHWRNLGAAVTAANEAGTGDQGVIGYLRDLHLPTGEHQLLVLAHGLWRGFGPALRIQDLWGMDRAVAARMLAGLAVAVDRENPAEILNLALSTLEGADLDDDSDSAEP